MEKLNDKQLSALKARIDETLRVRCFNVETKLEQVEDRRGECKMLLTSSKFNTVPVIHSAIELQAWTGGVRKDADDEKIWRFWVTVSARYHGNSVELFTVRGSVRADNENYIWFDDSELGIWID